MLKSRFFQCSFWLGLLITGLYWYSIHPLEFSRAYGEDAGFFELVRQVMAQQIQKLGHPAFTTDQVMTPFQVSLPYMTWAIEKDWLGGYFWLWNRDFPFFWFYFGISLLGSYLGVGLILRKMGLSKIAAWGFATAVVTFHIPRHFKIWYHYEHLPQHWVYWGLFLDAWIWQNFWRDYKWSWSLELWRGLCLLGVFGTAGYFWGPMLMIWALVRISIVILYYLRRKKQIATEMGGNILSALFPLFFGLFLFVLDLRWFLPLWAEVKRQGPVPQAYGWFAHLGYVVRPLWLDTFISRMNWVHLPPINHPETVVTIGWSYWIPSWLAIRFAQKKYGGPGLIAVLPFLIFLCIGILYLGTGYPYYIIQHLIQSTVPFMKFFRAASRWGLFLPQISTIIIVLAWPQITTWAQRLQKKKAWLLAFCCIFVSEVTWLTHPVIQTEPLSPSVTQMLEKIKKLPGTTVLDLPFCVAGGNGVCTEEQCPNYPASTAPACLRGWHDKKVYGLYTSRLVPSDCEYYQRSPYLSWFNAWKTQLCFTESEWSDFCKYLSAHSELSAVLVYPDIWTAIQKPECRIEFEKHLGSALGEDTFYPTPMRGDTRTHPSRIIWYPPHCVQ